MNAAWLQTLAVALSLAGVTLGAVALWLRQAWGRLHRLTKSLAELEADDALLWPYQAQAALRLAGVVALHWRGEWLGHALDDSWGRAPAHAAHWQRSVRASDDIQVEISAWWCAARGERAALAAVACRFFWLQWQAAARQQAGQLQATLAARARHALGLLHDMRNFAQWAVWTADAFASAQDDAALLEQARALAQRSDEVRTRAQALLARARGASAQDAAPPADLALLVRNTAALHGLPLALHGQAHSRTPTVTWISILDNLFINAMQHRKPQQPAPVGRLSTRDGLCEFELRLPGQTLDIPPQHLFVPLKSGRGDGLGLGLWQARRAARAAGGDLTAHTDPLCFVVRLP